GRRRFAVHLAVGFDVLGCDLLRGVTIGYLVEHQHETGGEYRALDLLPAQPEEIGQRSAVGLIDLTLVALIDQGRLRQYAGAACGGNEYRVGPGCNDFQTLAGDRTVAALKTLGSHELDVILFGKIGEHTQPVLSVRIVQPNEADRLHARLDHVLDERFGDDV